MDSDRLASARAGRLRRCPAPALAGSGIGRLRRWPASALAGAAAGSGRRRVGPPPGRAGAKWRVRTPTAPKSRQEIGPKPPRIGPLAVDLAAGS
jgi:hypothetical protein